MNFTQNPQLTTSQKNPGITGITGAKDSEIFLLRTGLGIKFSFTFFMCFPFGHFSAHSNRVGLKCETPTLCFILFNVFIEMLLIFFLSALRDKTD